MKNKKLLKRFDLKKFKEGAPAITRSGLPARFLGELKNHNFPIVAAIQESQDHGSEIHVGITYAGTIYVDRSVDDMDLFMAPSIREYWNIVVRTNRGNVITLSDDGGKAFYSEQAAREHVEKDSEEFENYEVLGYIKIYEEEV